MQKKFVQAMCAVLMGLFICSCSEPILPKQVSVKGTLNLPARIGSANLNSMLSEKIDKVFSSAEHEDIKAYNVDYRGQTVQTFCIYLPIEMTEDLNPNDFLKTIDRQINDGIKAEPKKISVSIPYLGFPIPIDNINMMDNIPPVSLAGIAQYVLSIDFDKCNGAIDSGIGINFHFTAIPAGLEMILGCDELKFSSSPKPLVPGDNIFGNKEGLTLNLAEYKNNRKKLNFTVTIQSSDPNNRNVLHINNLKPGDLLKIEGEMRFFRSWTSAKIDLSAALKASTKIDNLTGKFPDAVFDLSEMNKYLDGGFTFDDLEIKLYMDGPGPEAINALEPRLLMEAQYNNKKRNLYNDTLFVNSESIKIEDYLNKKGFYKNKHLPGNISEYEDKIETDTISDIFKTMPADLFFIYSIMVDDGKVLTVYPQTFDNDFGNFNDSSKITTIMMIMLPMSLTATGDNENKSAIYLPDMFGDNDLFGREKPESLNSSIDIDYIKITIDFANQIFSGGHLFINENKDIFPEGIKLNKKKIVINITDEEIKQIGEKLIFPSIKIEIDNDGMIVIPHDMAIIDIKLEMKSLITVGEL
jgi:hypothetical protein